MVKTRRDHPGAGRRRRTKELDPRTVKPRGQRLRLGRPRTSWGFFCDYFYRWWMSQQAFGADDVRPGTAAQVRRLPHHHARLDLNAQDGRAASGSTRPDPTSSPNALMLAACRAGHRPGPGAGRQPHFSYDQTTAERPQHRPATSAQRASRAPTRTPPTRCISGGGDITGYQAGSTFKMFTMVAALEKGYPLDYTINAEDRYKSTVHLEPEQPGGVPRHALLLPAERRQGRHGVVQHVDRLRPSVNTFFVPLEERVGAENVVDVAKRLRHPVPRTPSDDRVARRPRRRTQLGRVHPGRLGDHPAGHGQRLRDAGRRRQVLRADPGQRDQSTHDGEKLDVGNPHCTQAITPDVARAALDAARCPVGDQSAARQVRRRGTAPAGPRHRRPPGRPARPAPPTATRPPR